MKQKAFQALFYYLFFIMLISSVVFLIMLLMGKAELYWDWFYKVYLVIAILQTWYTFTLLMIGDFKRRKYQKYNGGKIAVVIPCFNEDPVLLKKSLTSVIDAEGNKEIIVVDDGSTNGIHDVLYKYAKDHGIQIHFLEKNMGKRHAVHAGIKRYLKDAEFVVAMDSDTVLNKRALINIVRPLQHPKIGAASGDVRLLNENTNALTKMVSAYYWIALHIQRKSQSAFGMVNCCSGALAGYKAELIRLVIDDFVNQEFFGEKCTYSDDRHLTNLILRSGHDVVFTPEAHAYTYTPETYGKFIRQQLRWRRGFIKEATFSMTFMWKVKPILFIEMFLWEIIMPFISFSIAVLVLINAFIDPLFFITGIIPSLLILMIVKNLPYIIHDVRKLPSLIHFTIFSNFILYWLGIHALFTVQKRSWITR